MKPLLHKVSSCLRPTTPVVESRSTTASRLSRLSDAVQQTLLDAGERAVVQMLDREAVSHPRRGLL
jgi:hypothetical protein